MPFPPEGLQVGELLLRAPTSADIPVIAPAFLDESVGGEAGLPKLTEPEIHAFIAERMDGLRESGKLLPLMIVDRDAVVGGSSLTNYDAFRDCVEVGYWLFAEGRGRGIATRVTRALTTHAFSVGVRRVEALVRPENTASIRVLDRARFTREGLMRSRLRHGDGRADAYLDSLLPGE